MYGVVASLPITGTSNFATNFVISTVQFPPAFTDTNTSVGMYDPAYPPHFAEDDERYCGSFDGQYGHHMGDYDTAVSDNSFVYYTWGDKRRANPGGLKTRRQGDIRLIRIPWH